MGENWKKYIKRSPYKDILKLVIRDILKDELEKYDIRSLRGYPGYKRLRKGKIRIIFVVTSAGNRIVAVDTRGDIYKNL